MNFTKCDDTYRTFKKKAVDLFYFFSFFAISYIANVVTLRPFAKTYPAAYFLRHNNVIVTYVSLIMRTLSSRANRRRKVYSSREHCRSTLHKFSRNVRLVSSIYRKRANNRFPPMEKCEGERRRDDFWSSFFHGN